jgi:prepilin signal peptidase PulO-like enzyme (type II secretory pathway)
MPDLAAVYDIARLTVIGASPDMPAYLWPLTASLFVILAATAFIDAKTGRIPDPPIFLGLLFGTGLMGFLYSWDESGAQLRWAVGAGLSLWAINALWYVRFRRDCLGMGDAKWTTLAVFAFGLKPVLIAWGAGACLALLWMAGARLCRRRVAYVHFAPFLLIGLIGGLWWVRFA